MIGGFIRASLGALGGGVVGSLAGLLGLAVGDRFSWMFSYAGVVVVSVFFLGRLQHSLRGIRSYGYELIEGFRNCVCGMEASGGIEIEVVYHLGLFSWEDRQDIIYHIKAKQTPVRVREFNIGQHPTHRTHPYEMSFRTLRELGISARDVTEQHAAGPKDRQVSAIPVRAEGNRLFMALCFAPPIAPGEERRTRISLRRPGLWNDLRRTGKDENCTYTAGPTPGSKLRIRVCGLPGIAPEDLRLVPIGDPAAVGGAVSRLNFSSDAPEAIWDIPTPQAGARYEYQVRCEPLHGFVRRLRFLIRRLPSPWPAP